MVLSKITCTRYFIPFRILNFKDQIVTKAGNGAETRQQTEQTDYNIEFGMTYLASTLLIEDMSYIYPVLAHLLHLITTNFLNCYQYLCVNVMFSVDAT